jgi:hypothetical protein
MIKTSPLQAEVLILLAARTTIGPAAKISTAKFSIN